MEHLEKLNIYLKENVDSSYYHNIKELIKKRVKIITEYHGK
jgi:hypothetical protein